MLARHRRAAIVFPAALKATICLQFLTLGLSLPLHFMPWFESTPDNNGSVTMVHLWSAKIVHQDAETEELDWDNVSKNIRGWNIKMVQAFIIIAQVMNLIVVFCSSRFEHLQVGRACGFFVAVLLITTSSCMLPWFSSAYPGLTIREGWVFSLLAAAAAGLSSCVLAFLASPQIIKKVVTKKDTSHTADVMIPPHLGDICITEWMQANYPGAEIDRAIRADAEARDQAPAATAAAASPLVVASDWVDDPPKVEEEKDKKKERKGKTGEESV